MDVRWGINQAYLNGGSSKLRSLRECSRRPSSRSRSDGLDADLQVLADAPARRSGWPGPAA